MTQWLSVEPNRPNLALLTPAAEALRGGGTVAFPTETVYGLGANALLPEAVAHIFTAKGRPSDNPLIVHIATLEALPELVREVPPAARILAERFWPGPLTLVMPKSDRVPDAVTAGLATVAVRMPDHDVALALISLAGCPVAAPSANRSGRPSPTTAEHVRADLDGLVDFIVDGGPAGIGVESTVVDATTEPPTLLRPGGVTREDLIAVLGQLAVDPALETGRPVEAGVVPRSPGMKYRHYAPRAPLTLVAPREGEDVESFRQRVWREVETASVGDLGAGGARTAKTGLLVLDEDMEWFAAKAKDGGVDAALVSAGPRSSPAVVATRLFGALRHFDDIDVTRIIAEGVGENGLGFAVMNRLRKAAGGRVIG